MTARPAPPPGDLPARIPSKYVEVDGMRIHYRHEDGPGPPLVLLPGGILDHATLVWKDVLRALPEAYDVYVPDLPGYGYSDAPPAACTTEFFVRFLEGFLDAVGLDTAFVGGSSMSGAVVLGFALQHPARVQALILSGAYGFQPRVPFHELAYLLSRLPGLGAALRGLLGLHPNVVRLALPVSVYQWEQITNELVMDSYEGVRQDGSLAAFFRWLRTDLLPRRVRSDFTPFLPHLAMPVLILHGAHDWTMPVRYARRAAALLPDATLHVFDRSGHLVPREQPDEVTAALVDFLERVG